MRVVLVTALSLAACATTPGRSSGACQIPTIDGLIGKPATAELVRTALRDSGALLVRVLAPDQIVTMDFRAGRLNISVDAANIVTEFRCG